MLDMVCELQKLDDYYIDFITVHILFQKRQKVGNLNTNYIGITIINHQPVPTFTTYCTITKLNKKINLRT